ncbi:MAG TPA: sugar ABC transporter substrate-binding protein, partial [Propionibacteriaceae bacterium]
MSDTRDAPSRVVSRRRLLATSALAAFSSAGSSVLLSACGGGGTSPSGTGSGGAKKGGTVTWGSWANPGEAERFRKYSADYQAKTGTKVIYQVVSGSYETKLLTQLSGGSAPDAFYVGDTSMARMIEANVLEPLDTYLASPDATVKFEDTYAGLSKWCKSTDGKIFGIPVDCNPHAFWFNKKVLTAAGVTQDPAAAFDAGAWNQAAMTDLLTKVKAAGKKGGTLESNWFDIFSWVTTFGGTAFDESGKAVFDTDPKAKAALEWLIEQVKNGNMTYGGSLPKGQGVDALFYAGQLATLGYGRWVLPNLKKLKKTVDYDIAPMPSVDGKTVMPVAIYTAAMSVNAKAKDKDAAQRFLGDFVNADGQKARLSGGGNAVPSRAGLDDIVTEGNDPPHAKLFTEIAKKGYATPLLLARSPVKSN